MYPLRSPWSCLALLPVALLWQPGEETIPQTNRPGNFSGAAGLYTIQVRATPTAVRVEDPITLTIKIVSQKPGPWKYPPQRDKLKLFTAALEYDFFLEPLPEEDRFLPEEKAWEFSWRLLPRSTAVAKIPEPEFVYYRTTEPLAFTIAEGGSAIPVTVKPRTPAVLAGPNTARERLENIAEGDDLLVQDRSDAIWWTVVIAGLVMPPLGCWALYFAWRQGFPEAAERLRRRRSRALKTALAELRRLGHQAAPDRIRAIVVEYLHSHVPLQPGEPTPMEIRLALASQGLTGPRIDQTVAVVTACDTRRFGPAADAAAQDLSTSASQMLQALEIALCASRS